jgi:hypothetical protein
MAPPVIAGISKNRSETDKKKAADLKVIKDERNRIEKEKADYQKERDAEVQKILELKSQVEAGASNVQAEYDRLEKERNEKRDQTEDFEEQLKRNGDEMDALGDAEYLKQEPADDLDLPPKSPDEEGTDYGREGGPLFTIDDLRKALGQEEMGTVIAWRPGGGNQRVVISRYGPRNARKYRLQKGADADGSWQEDKVDMFTKKSLRYGAMKDDNNKFIHGGSEAKGIVAVAWYFGDDDEEPEKLMLPKTRPKPVEGTRRPPLYVECQSMVQWEIDGEEKFSWEIRDTIVRLYKSATTADNLIYLYAQSQETRYRQWKRKERKSEDRSPTPMPGLLRPRATPEPEEVDKKPAATSSGGTSDEAEEIAAMKKWAIKKKLNPDHLTDAEEARFDVYYRAFKAAEVAAVAPVALVAAAA